MPITQIEVWDSFPLFFFFFFFGPNLPPLACGCSLGQGLNPRRSCSNAGFLIRCAGLGIEPEPQQ